MTNDPGFLARHAATEAALQAYVATLPVWVNVWRRWMFLVFTLALLFLVRKPEARWLAATMVVSLFAYNLVAMRTGPGRFPSIAFVVLWSPLALYLARRRARLVERTTFDALYGWWIDVALVTVTISLAFDVYNVAYSVLRGVR